MRTSKLEHRAVLNAVAPKRQQGVVLIITLIVLIAMTLATIALVRSVDTSNVIVGNLAFKQGATRAGDKGNETAAAWLKPFAGKSVTFIDDPLNGYYATAMDIDVTGNGTDPNRYLVDWAGNACDGSNLADSSHCLSPAPTAIDAGAGNTVQYIIDRLCYFNVGPKVDGNCPTIYSDIEGQPNGDNGYQGDPPTATYVEFYRITSRIQGPRNTVSYVETIVHY